jgi:hypothetical protein
MATANDIIVAAHGFSTKNRPNLIATSATELLRRLNKSLNVYFMIGARINPMFYGVKDEVAYDGTLGWPRPACADAVWRIEQAADGAEVALVPFDQRFAEPGMPAVYTIGQHYIPAGNDGDPLPEDNLNIFYSKRPVSIGALTDSLDPMWQGAYDTLPTLDIAIYLAVKDGRLDEVAELVRERDEVLKLYIAFLEHADLHERRWFGPTRFNQTNSIVPLLSLLPGGAQADRAA